ncbi:MAG: glycosyltransferase family 4 protein [Thermoanaerobaculia bacterium]
MRRPRVVVASVQSPFLSGGAERHVDRLTEELQARGVEAEKVTIPFFESTHFEVVQSALAWKFGDFERLGGEKVDAVIATRFPSYLARHRRKVVWLIHQYRVVYDQYGTAYSDFTGSEEDRRIREMVRHMDTRSLSEARRVFANSRNVAERLRKYNGVASEALYHPPPLAGRYRQGEAGESALWVGRLERWKRPGLAIGALVHAPAARLKIVGDGPERAALESFARSAGVESRCEFLGRVTDEELLGLFANARLVLATAADEDYGYVPLEAFLSGKAVVTVTDAGGPLEFVQNDSTGYVAAPTPEALGAMIDRVWDRTSERLQLAERGRAAVERISWDHVIDTLLGAAGL